MRRLSLIFFALFVFACQSEKAIKDGSPLDVRAARKDMLSLVQNLPRTKTIVRNLKNASPEQRELIRIYTEEYLPRQEEQRRTTQEYYLLLVAIHRVLYSSETEKESWKERTLQLKNRGDALLADPEFKAIVQRMGAAAQGLTGELAEFARNTAHLEQLTGFSTTELPLLARLNELNQQIESASLDSPAKNQITAFNVAFEQLEVDLHSGRITFQEAVEKTGSIYGSSLAAYGQEFAPKVREQFNEAARIRSRLAKSKGFPSWAAYALATQSLTIAPGYRTTEERLHFLSTFLEATQDTFRSYLAAQAARISGGVNLDHLSRTEHHFLQIKADTLGHGYFPLHRIDAIWGDTMKRAGFLKSATASIRWDNLPRENKYGHAYIAPIITPSLRRRVINAKDLSIESPAFNRANWNPAHIFVVQNFRGDSPNNLRTKFHEGGHGLEFSAQADIFGVSSPMANSPANSETHSTFMEMMMNDPLFWHHHARNAEGVSPDPVLVSEILARKGIAFLVELRRTIINSMLDIELWNNDYDQPDAPEFFERILELSGWRDQVTLISNPSSVADVDGRYAIFSTEHFYSGEVTFIGYVYAEIAATLLEQHLLDHFENTTGRRGIYNQPDLARLLTNGLYRSGFRTPFPMNIENFTGLQFDPAIMAQIFNERLSEGIQQLAQENACENAVKAAP